MRNIVLISLIFGMLNVYAQHNSISYIETLLCKEWKLKYNEIDNKIYPASKGHHFDKLIFYKKDRRVEQYSPNRLLSGIWSFSQQENIIKIKDANGSKTCKLISLTDSSLVFHINKSEGEKINVYMIPVSDKSDNKNCNLYSLKEIPNDKFKLLVKFPFEPNNMDRPPNKNYSIKGYQFDYPDTTYENLFYGALICDFKIVFEDINKQVYNYAQDFIKKFNGKLLRIDTIKFNGCYAIKTKYEAYLKSQGCNMIFNSIVFSQNNAIIHLYVASPLKSKGNKQLECFFNSVKIK
jgi:hypothetical protein